MTARLFCTFAAVAIVVTFGLVMLTARVIWPHMGPLVAEADGGACGLIGLAIGFVVALVTDR